MKKRFELLSGIVLLLASLFSILLINSGKIGTCAVIGGNWFNYFVAYLIAAVFALIGIAYLLRSFKIIKI
jgi:hypothetical protein